MLKIFDISKSYNSTVNNKKFSVLSSISFEANEGDIISIYGPNGSGKSTLLNIIAGSIKPDKGSIDYGKEQIKIGYVWQNYSASLFPWYSVKKNIELPLIVEVNNSESTNVASDILQELEFNIRLDAYPYQLSGGQQQMVSIARALSNNPSIVILDEPFSALDKKKREQALIGLHKYFEKKKPIVFFVSHSLDEAILFSNKLVLLSDVPGKIIGILNIDLKKPRNISILTSSEFINYRNSVLKIINEEII